MSLDATPQGDTSAPPPTDGGTSPAPDQPIGFKRKRGRPRKNPLPNQLPPPIVVDRIGPDGFPPVRHADGSLNREHFAARLRSINALQQESLRTDQKALAGYEQLKRGIIAEAEVLGLSDKEVLDERSDHDRVIEAVDRMLSSQGQSIFEEADATLIAMERSIKASIENTQDILNQERSKILERAMHARRGNRPPSREVIEAGKMWLSLLDRVRRLRTLVRFKIPKMPERLQSHQNSDWTDAYEASWLWRIAVYLYRSDLPTNTASPSEGVLEIAEHHCHMAVNLWKNRNQITIYATAFSLAEHQSDPTLFYYPEKRHGPATYSKRNDFVCSGTVIVCPPRHGKSTLGTSWMVSEYVENARLQGILLHAIEDKAAENFRHVKAAFDPTTTIGRRCISLFGIRLSKDDDRKDKMRLLVREKTRDPQLRACGVKSGVGGANTDIQWWDDPVAPEERDQPAVRENTYRKLTQQFMRRQQGDRSFTLITATLWDADDSVSRILQRSRLNGPSRIAYGEQIQIVGHPKSAPPFFPLWPAKYPASKLRHIYNEMNDAAAYLAQYCAITRADERRIVRRLAFYDPTTTEHAEFLARAEFHVSLDPSATSRAEATTKTDKAGLVYAAVGDIVRKESGEHSETVSTASRIRVIDIREFHAGPMEAVDVIGEYALTRKVDKVHVEVVTFSSAIVDLIRQRYGLSSAQVIAHGTGSRSKELRLRSVASMLDDCAKDEGMAGAVVEFPGVVDEHGQLTIDPLYAWAAKQIIDFGSVKGDHCVDALTQFLRFIQPSVSAGAGEITEAIRLVGEQTPASIARERIAEVYRRHREQTELDAWDQELVAMNQWGV